MGNKSPLTLGDIIDQKKLLDSFINIKSKSNIGVMKCYKLLFSKEGIIYNIGSYLLLLKIFINIISFIYFVIKGKKSVYNEIYNINLIKKEIIKLNKSDGNILKINKKNENKLENIINDDQILKIKIKFNEDINQIKSNNNLITSFHNINKNENSEIKTSKYPKELNSTTEYNDYEINSFPYEKAVKIDKRTFFQQYISSLKANHLLIFAFCPNNDYNSKIIKICLFFFSFSLYLFVNTLFFNDKTMHNLYENKGILDFIYFIPTILYSNIICIVINKIIKMLALSDKNILEFKRLNNIDRSEKQFGKLIRRLNIKFILFFILNLLFLSLFWYYVSCFCAVYKRTQINLIKDTLISFGLSLIYPFVLYLFISYIRILLLKKSGKFLQFFFKISKLLS